MSDKAQEQAIRRLKDEWRIEEYNLTERGKSDKNPDELIKAILDEYAKSLQSDIMAKEGHE